MSEDDMESEKFVTTEEDDESYTKTILDKAEHLTIIKSRAKKGSNESKNSRQKYCPRWEEIFPWLKADKEDESMGICTVCDKRLVVKKSHLERHQSSFKHQRLGGIDVFYKTEDSFAVFLEDDNEKNDDDYEYEQLEPEEYLEMTTIPPKKRTKKTSPKRMSSSKQVKREAEFASRQQKGQLNRLKLLKRIDRDRSELNEYYYARQKDIQSMVIPPSTSPKQRDSFDLFFDSVSASVKSLPPKLSYEIKSQISQLVSEFELRALCEKEAMEHASREGATNLTPVLVSPSFENQVKPLQVTTSIDASTMPHLVYTFQQKT